MGRRQHTGCATGVSATRAGEESQKGRRSALVEDHGCGEHADSTSKVHLKAAPLMRSDRPAKACAQNVTASSLSWTQARLHTCSRRSERSAAARSLMHRRPQSASARGIDALCTDLTGCTEADPWAQPSTDQAKAHTHSFWTWSKCGIKPYSLGPNPAWAEI